MSKLYGKCPTDMKVLKVMNYNRETTLRCYTVLVPRQIPSVRRMSEPLVNINRLKYAFLSTEDCNNIKQVGHLRKQISCCTIPLLDRYTLQVALTALVDCCYNNKVDGKIGSIP